MAKRNDILNFEIYVGDRPIEELAPEEREEFAQRVVDRLGNAFNIWFSTHPEEYKKI